MCKRGLYVESRGWGQFQASFFSSWCLRQGLIEPALAKSARLAKPSGPLLPSPPSAGIGLNSGPSAMAASTFTNRTIFPALKDSYLFDQGFSELYKRPKNNRLDNSFFK